MRNPLTHLFSALFTLAVIFTLTFFLIRWIPGGPYSSDRALPPEIEARIQEQYGLHHPVSTQFVLFIRDALKGDFPDSFHYSNQSVKDILGHSLRFSLKLGACALALSLSLGLMFGVFSLFGKGFLLNRTLPLLSAIGLSLPSYLIASILVLIFSTYLGWLPPALWEGPESMILPIVALSVRPIALIVLMT